jgi:hypothetical protein
MSPGPIENIAAKTVTQVDPASSQTGAGKTGDSAKFEQVRQSLQSEAPGGITGTEGSGLPKVPEITQTERKQLERDLRRRLEKTNSTNPGNLFGQDVRHLGRDLERVKAKVESTPKSKQPAGARERLVEVESQYHALGEKLKNMPDTNNLRDLMEMQTQMFQMSQNIELLTKVVDSAMSGIKSTMQMQI